MDISISIIPNPLITTCEDILTYLDEFADRLPQSKSRSIDGKRIYFSARTPVVLRDPFKRFTSILL